MEKRFSAYWGGDYHKPETRQVGLEFFSEDNGYSESDIAAIERLEIGQAYKHDSSSHTVTRIS